MSFIFAFFANVIIAQGAEKGKRLPRGAIGILAEILHSIPVRLDDLMVLFLLVMGYDAAVAIIFFAGGAIDMSLLVPVKASMLANWYFLGRLHLFHVI